MKKGRLTIFLSYTPGAGKSYIMKQWGEQERINGKNVITAFINDMHRDANNCNKIDTVDMVGASCDSRMNIADKVETKCDDKKDEDDIMTKEKTRSHKYSLSEIINHNPDLVLMDEMGMGGLNMDEVRAEDVKAKSSKHECTECEDIKNEMINSEENERTKNVSNKHNNFRYKSHIYDDIDRLLDRGIDVYTTANLKRFDGMNPRFKQISGIGIKTTIPDRYLDMAEKIVFVDRNPNALIKDFESGKLFNKKYMKSGIMKKNFREDILYSYRKLSLEILDKYKDKLEIVNNDFIS